MSISDIIDASRGVDPEAEEGLLAGLNPEQREAVLHEEGPALLVAVAGAGKTRVLVHRLARLVKVKGVHPGRILAVTFSKKGADEMNERLKGLIGETDARVGTFHSVALEIHRVERLGCFAGEWDWQVDAKERFRTLLKEVTGYRHMNWKKADVTVIASYIDSCKSAMARPGSDEAIQLAEDLYAKEPAPKHNPALLHEAYERAEELRRERRMLTFSDMLLDAAEALRDNEGLRQRWAARWDWVMQDEAQDQNLVQLLMGSLLAKDHKNYVLVGDPAQTIYTWRGARPEKLLSFEDEWGARVIKMGRNYRCGQTIIDAANRALGTMDPATKLPLDMICEKGTEGMVTSTEFVNLEEEGEAVARRITQLLEDGVQPRDIAILYRTNAQSRAPEEALIGERVPYRIIGGTSFYERREVKNLLAYLRVAAGYGKFSDWLDSMEKCINTPFRYLGKVYVQKVRDVAKMHARRAKSEGTRFSWLAVIRETNERAGIQRRQRYAAEDWARMIEDLRDIIQAGAREGASEEQKEAAFPARILDSIVHETRYTEFLIRDEGEESTENSRVSNVREMVRAAGRFPSVRELLAYVDKTVAASRRKREEKDPNKVTLCSIHRSKGLEWPVVFVIGCAEGILPHGRAEEPEEERRLFYVATTRAKDELHYSYAINVAVGNRVVQLPPSPYLSEVGHEATPAPAPDPEADFTLN